MLVTAAVFGRRVQKAAYSQVEGQLAKDDPLVYPGQPGVSHLHQFFGNTGTTSGSVAASL